MNNFKMLESAIRAGCLKTVYNGRYIKYILIIIKLHIYVVANMHCFVQVNKLTVYRLGVYFQLIHRLS